MPADPSPIRGRWTITVMRCPVCGGVQLDGGGERFCGATTACQTRRNGYIVKTDMERVALVPVPDEAAIERGAKAHEEHDGAGIGWHPETSTYAVYFPNDEIVPGYDTPENAAADVDRLVALAVLRAALEPTDP